MAQIFPFPGPGIIGSGPSGVIFDNSCSAVASSTTSLTCSLPIGAISKGAVAMGLIHYGSIPTGISCTVGGMAASLISGTAGATAMGAESWGLATGSATGATTISCSWTGSVDSAMGAISVSGANQTTPFVNGTFSQGSSGPPTLVISSATGHLTFSVGAPSAMPTSNSQTAFFTTQIPFSIWTSGQYGNGAATVTHSWTTGVNQIWAISGADIQP